MQEIRFSMAPVKKFFPSSAGTAVQGYAENHDYIMIHAEFPFPHMIGHFRNVDKTVPVTAPETYTIFKRWDIPGMIHVSARPCVQRDHLTMDLPFRRFMLMADNREESSLITES